MIKAVLLDLDNTLLHNPDALWVGEFRQQWDQHFATCCGSDNASAALRSAIGCLNAKPALYRKNSDLMLDRLAGDMAQPTEEISAAVSGFYAGPYNRLKALTSPVARARELVEHLLKQDILVAIATNPLFPQSATLSRIEWAGLGEFISSFAFITHSENMRFAKPSPAYFAETVARLGVEPDEALVIGDSMTNDIDPARAIGIHTWQVNGTDGLAGIYAHVRKPNWQHEYLPRQLHQDMILPQYIGNLAALYGLLAEVKAHQWLQRPDPDEWSILQILCHLWQSEKAVHQYRLQTILYQDDPFITAPPPPGPHIAPCHDNSYEVMYCFQRDREETITLLAELRSPEWERPARHSIFGLTNMLEMAHFTAQHDRLHITQLCQTLGKCAD